MNNICVNESNTKILKLDLMSQEVYRFEILIGIAKLLPLEAVPVYTFTSSI